MSIIETMIDVPADHMQNVCGQLDSYMKKIERSLRVSLIPRDDAIKIIGPEGAVKKAKSVFSNLLELSHRGNTITEQNVDYALSLSFEEKDEQILRSIRISSAARSLASRSSRRPWVRRPMWMRSARR